MNDAALRLKLDKALGEKDTGPTRQSSGRLSAAADFVVRSMIENGKEDQLPETGL